jgi:transposase
MTGLTIREIAEKLGISPKATMARLLTAGIQPKTHAGKTNIYDESVVEILQNTPSRGRPKKAAK